jgi:hypothetical protein
MRSRCHYCGQPFTALRRSARYCSVAHRVAAHRRKPQVGNGNAASVTKSRGLTVERITLAEANAFVGDYHRHHKAVQGHVFSIAAALDNVIVGVAIVGRPVARLRDDGRTAEITRLCTDGTPNACSFLYGAAARAAYALGFKRLGTYISAHEPGTSLVVAANVGGGKDSVRDVRKDTDVDAANTADAIKREHAQLVCVRSEFLPTFDDYVRSQALDPARFGEWGCGIGGKDSGWIVRSHAAAQADL